MLTVGSRRAAASGLLGLFLASCASTESVRVEPCPAGPFAADCRASQEDFHAAYREIMDRYGILRVQPGSGTVPAAWADLPRDHFGQVNWAKAVYDGLLQPKDSITGGPVQGPPDGPFPNFIPFNVKAAMMADVLFPHDIHNFWLDCKNCHPAIFKPKIGANPMSMRDIWQGKFCGRCHGTVAFETKTETNCRRCHSIRKNL
ncbi:MAG: c(7)-type cytochrome triheme domain-containing protein [Nitrospirota bacterium]